VKILVIDDSLMDRRLLTSFFNKSAIENEVLQACDGEEGLKLLSENYEDICLIICDWQMPKMDGIEFMKGVAQVPTVASIPIIMVTASGSEEDKKKAAEVNPNLAGYLVKPYSREKLISMIAPHIK